MDADAALPDDPELLKRMIRELLAMLATRDRELEGVQRRLDQLLRRLYGPKSEAFRPDQPTLFAIPGEPEPATPPTSDAPVSPTAKPKPKRGHGRRRLPDDLRRRTRPLDDVRLGRRRREPADADLSLASASLLLLAGVDAKTVSSRLGHSSVGFTKTTYQHMISGMQAKAAGVLAELLSGEIDHSQATVSPKTSPKPPTKKPRKSRSLRGFG